MSLHSFGERVAVTITATGDQSATLTVQSGPGRGSGIGGSHGKPDKNVSKIIARTSEILAVHGAEWRTEAGLDPVEPFATASVADELAKLAGLRDRGILTGAEFGVEKARLLAR